MRYSPVVGVVFGLAVCVSTWVGEYVVLTVVNPCKAGKMFPTDMRQSVVFSSAFWRSQMIG